MVRQNALDFYGFSCAQNSLTFNASQNTYGTLLFIKLIYHYCRLIQSFLIACHFVPKFDVTEKAH